ncbi:unnamed protein product [Prorocentrum cordatum]|uniref:Uncharacterized protein n=1 Tax=Prorocentrum cordatum TaxID=2364126 RepID=A0ABN9PDV4_9DINO|nr:unnamed protein product [Polarella glacialis]
METQNATIEELKATGPEKEGGRLRRQLTAAIIGDKVKLPTFDNSRKPYFHDWSYKFKAFVGNHGRKCLEGMAQVELSQNELNYANYDDEERKQMAQSLFYLLTMYSKGIPLGIISFHYDPQKMGSILSRLMKALEFDFGGKAELLDNIAKFGILIEEYEKLPKEQISDNIRTAVLIARAPEALRNHALLAMPKEEIQWPRANKVAGDFLLTKQPMPGGPTPINTSAINSETRREGGKGKDGEIKSKGEDGGKGKD